MKLLLPKFLTFFLILLATKAFCQINEEISKGVNAKIKAENVEGMIIINGNAENTNEVFHSLNYFLVAINMWLGFTKPI